MDRGVLRPQSVPRFAEDVPVDTLGLSRGPFGARCISELISVHLFIYLRAIFHFISLYNLFDSYLK